MVDRIATLDETLGRVLGPRRGAGARALEEYPVVVVEDTESIGREVRERRLRLARAR
jgi:hypothetical protein